jgi:hypothetical protein
MHNEQVPYHENRMIYGKNCTWHKIFVSFLSTTFVQNIFRSSKYLARYTSTHSQKLK